MARNCWCTAQLLTDGTCRYRCDPALRPSAMRAQQARARREARAAALDERTIGIGQGDQSRLSEVVARFDPVTAFKRRRAQHAANKSHSVGSRR